MQEPVNKRKALALLDGISGGAGIEAIVSFPGLFQDPDNAFFSTACVFLPDGDPNSGQHYANDIDNDGKCFCHKLYGEKKAWGCKWFHIWRNQFLEILRRGQTPVVVYKFGQVALVKEYMGERFIKRDVKDVSKAIADASFQRLCLIIRGVQGARKLAAAIASSHAAQQGLKSLVFVDAEIGEAGAQALAEQLPKLLALKSLRLSQNRIGEAGGRALAEQLPKLPALKVLDLCCIGEAAARALAQQLPKLPALKVLYIGDNNIGEAGAWALAGQLPKLPALEGLCLRGNKIGEAGACALAEQLLKLPSLKTLYLDSNKIGEAGARALAEQLPKLPALEVLSLCYNIIGKAGRALLEKAKPRQLTLRF